MRLATTLSALLLGCLLPLVAASAPGTAVSVSATDAPAATKLQQLGGETMGTTWSVTLQADAAASTLQHGVQARLDTVVAQMSTWEPDSDLSRFNGAPAGTRHQLPEQLQQVMKAALALAAETGGAFDPTVGPLVNLWGFGPGGERNAPGVHELSRARAVVGWKRLDMDATGAITQPGNAYVDLSGIAKGFAVDQVAAFLLEQGVPVFLVEVGGELRSHGRKPDGTTWRIAVEQPSPADFTSNAGIDPRVVMLDGMAMATSGDYRHFFDEGHRRYSHTIDPRTGHPVSHGLASVTVLHRDCMQADALATALTVLGPKEGWNYARQHDIAALLVWHDGVGFKSRMTPGFRGALAQP